VSGRLGRSRDEPRRLALTLMGLGVGLLILALALGGLP
jgi:Tfp pilus assembly protein PilN